MLTVRGQQHSLSTHERVFSWKCQRFWDRKCLDLRGTRTPNLRIHAKCSNLLSYQGQTLAVPCFEHWLWWYRWFWSKVNIRNVNCAWATAFILNTRIGVLVKVSKFLRQKMSRPEGDSVDKLRKGIITLSHICYRTVKPERPTLVAERRFVDVCGIKIQWQQWYDDVIKWKRFPCYWPFVREIHGSTVNLPHKGQ